MTIFSILKRTFLKFWLHRLENAIERAFDRTLSLRIDSIMVLLETEK